ncbi:MAG TPA: hypothetical protein VNN10_02700 [Dehalococcoidia bacterium]|nr:hypothetical protein [Dehalococcoidia bacterium]
MLRSLLVLALLLLPASGCAGQDRGVLLEWDADGTSVQISDESAGAPPLRTVVYVTNNTDVVIRNATIKLRDEGAELAAGLNVGTVTSVSTQFEGKSRVWRLGDLEAGKRYGLPIGLWLSSAYLSAAPDRLVLSVELISPDLAQPLRSELALSVRK